VGIKEYLLKFLANSTNPNDDVTKMIMLLLARITKLSWFDDPDIKSVVTELH
jgi:hypothetical protein